LSPSGFHHVLLGAQLGGQNSSSGTSGGSGQGGITAVRFLEQNQEREIRLGAETREISLANA